MSKVLAARCWLKARLATAEEGAARESRVRAGLEKKDQDAAQLLAQVEHMGKEEMLAKDEENKKKDEETKKLEDKDEETKKLLTEKDEQNQEKDKEAQRRRMTRCWRR